MQALGGSLFCVGSRHLKIITMGVKYFIDGIRMMVLGGIFMTMGLLISVAFAFYFLHAILQLALLGAMMPLMIAGWPFKKTSGPASSGLNFLLNSFFMFFFTGFVISVNLELIDQSMKIQENIRVNDYVYEEVNEETAEQRRNARKYNKQLQNAQVSEKGFEAITKAMNEQNMAALDRATDIGGGGFLLLIFASIFGFIFLKEVVPLASKLSSGVIGGKSIGGQIGGRMGSMAKAAATKVTKPISNAYTNAGGAVGLVGATAKHVGNAIDDIATASGRSGSRFGRGLARFGSGVQRFGKKIKK